MSTQTVVSTSGRSQKFIKGEPTWAPPQMHAELIAKGIVPTEDIPEIVVTGVREPQGSEERETAIMEVYEKLVLKGSRKDFTGTGSPHLAVLKSELGWEVAAKERDTVWHKFQQERSTI